MQLQRKVDTEMFRGLQYLRTSQCHNVRQQKDFGRSQRWRAVVRDKHKHIVLCRTRQSHAAGRRVESKQLNTVPVIVSTALSRMTTQNHDIQSVPQTGNPCRCTRMTRGSALKARASLICSALR